MDIKTKLIGNSVLFFLTAAFFTFLALQHSEKIVEKDIANDLLASTEGVVLRTGDHIEIISLPLTVYIEECDILQENIAGSNKKFDSMDDPEGYINSIDKKWNTEEENKSKEILSEKSSCGLQHFTEFYREETGYDIFSEIIVTNKYGATVSLTGKSTDYRQNDEKWWKEAEEKGEYIGKSAYDESAGLISITDAFRLEDKDGNFIGVVKAEINTTALIDHIISPYYKPTGVTRMELVSGNGEILYSQNFGKEEHMPVEVYLEKTINGPGKGSFVIKDRGPKTAVAYARLTENSEEPGRQLVLISSQNIEGGIPVMKIIKERVVFLFGATIMISIAFSLFVSKSITDPIEELTEIIEKISIGNIDVKMSKRLKKRDDEIGELARAFERVVISLKLAMRKAK